MYKPKKIEKTKWLLLALLPLQIIGLQVLKFFPQLVEDYYSLGVYPLISKASRYLFGWVPFSVGDVFYLLITLMALRWLYANIRYAFKRPLAFFVDIGATFSIVYFFFHMLWGLNYYRQPIHKTIGIDNTYTTAELKLFTNKLVAKANEMHIALGYADSVKINLPYSQAEIFTMTQNGYNNIQDQYPMLAYKPVSIKKSGWSTGLTYMGYSGYLNPFSNEAQVNNLITTYKFPVVS